MTRPTDGALSAAKRRTTRLTLTAPLFVACIVSACGITPRYGRLDGVVVRGASDETPSSDQLRVIRPSGVASTYVGMEIRKSDTVSTSHDTRARLTLLQSYEVTLDTGTVIIIENPSIFVRLGQLFIRKLTGHSDSIAVHTNHTTILDKGTSFFVRVRSDDFAQVFVADGAVTIAPRSGGDWSPRTLGAGQGATFNGASAPSRMEGTAAVLNAELSWVRQVDSLIRAGVPRVDAPPRVRPPGRDARTPQVIPAPPPAVDRPTLVRPDSTRVCRVPDVSNRSEPEARKLIAAAGYVPLREGVAGDYVARQTPAAQERTPCGKRVVYFMASNIQ